MGKVVFFLIYFIQKGHIRDLFETAPVLLRGMIYFKINIPGIP